MFKHRGHFYSSVDCDGHMRGVEDVYPELVNLTTEILGETFRNDIDVKSIEDLLSSKNYSRSEKVIELAALLSVSKKEKVKYAILKALCGLSINIKTIFTDLSLEEKYNICFSETSYEEKQEEILQIVGEDYFSLIELMRELYNIGVLAGILKGCSYLSEAKIQDYEKHKEDLALLKAVIKKFGSADEYNNVFRKDTTGSYSAYVNSTNSNKKLRRSMSGRNKDTFYKTIKKMLENYSTEDADVNYILSEIEKETFLPKQLTNENSIIPNQIHEKEMKQILKNAEEYLPFLKNIDESGLTVSERIIKLFTFCIPYYIGPTSSNSELSGGNGWVVRKEEGQVLPWNIDEKIDIRKTSEEFILRMIRRCTYISDEKVLPKSSLLYQKFCVLNEINNIRINGKRISVALKQDIYTDLFLNGKQVSKKKLVSYLKKKGEIEEGLQVSGVDKELNSSLSSYGKLKAIFGDNFSSEEYQSMAEDIIFWTSVYGNSKDMLKLQIEEHYKDKIDSDMMKKILNLKFEGWGKLSKEFLGLYGCNKKTGEVISIIDALWDTNYNLMELLYNKQFNFSEELEKKQNNKLLNLSDISPEDLDEYYFSPLVKKMIWQSLTCIKEVVKVMGGPPERIFIKMMRTEEEKGEAGRTSSRKKQLLKLYKGIKNNDKSFDFDKWKKEIEEADDNGTLKSKKMYLYFKQMGRCMYSGRPIDKKELFNNNIYDTDHIYPKHFCKDNNIENNLVLTEKQINSKKNDIYPLKEAIQITKEVEDFWKTLLRNELISEEKYYRLTRNTKFTDEEKADFIASQIVQVGQETKGLADILKQVLPQSTIIYTKASNVSDFRRHYNLLKSRVVNDAHFAQDAYLNVVVGNAYYVKFTQNPLNFIKKEYLKDPKKHAYNMNRIFAHDIKRRNEVAWIASKDDLSGTIETVRKVLAKTSVIMTRTSFEENGQIADLNPYSAKVAKKESYLPLKATDKRLEDVSKYGGLGCITTAYFFLVEHDEKSKKVRTIEMVPVYLKKQIEEDPNGLLNYCTDKLKLVNPVIKISKIKNHSLIKVNGYLYYLTGRSGNRLRLYNAINLYIPQDWVNYLKNVESSVKNKYLNKNITLQKNIDLYTLLLDKHKNSIFRYKCNSMGDLLEKGFSSFKKLPLDKQCQVLIQIFSLTAIGPVSGDLSLIGGSPNSGILGMNKKISEKNEVTLINQSVTGIYEKHINLLTV